MQQSVFSTIKINQPGSQVDDYVEMYRKPYYKRVIFRMAMIVERSRDLKKDYYTPKKMEK